jgi:hypothetical protein
MGSIYRAHGPSTEPGNSSTSWRVHSGGLSQLLRNDSSSRAASAIAAFPWFAIDCATTLRGSVEPKTAQLSFPQILIILPHQPVVVDLKVFVIGIMRVEPQ